MAWKDHMEDNSKQFHHLIKNWNLSYHFNNNHFAFRKIFMYKAFPCVVYDEFLQCFD